MNNIKSTREAFIAALKEIAYEDKKCVLVSADSLAAMRGIPFANEFPDRVFDVGIAEQNAIGVSAGLAALGLTPFICTYSGFITMRACEQVRTFVAYPNLNVKMIGLNGGMFGGEREGVTHQFFEDLGILRSIPNMKIITPCDANEVYAATKLLNKIEGPVFMRIGSGKEEDVYNGICDFNFGNIKPMAVYGYDALIFTSGFIMNRVLKIADDLCKQGIKVTVINVPTLKPIDRNGILSFIDKCPNVVTIEDHNIIGGLGSAVSEIISSCNNAILKRIGLLDTFPSSGRGDILWDNYGLSEKDIIDTIKSFLK